VVAELTTVDRVKRGRRILGDGDDELIAESIRATSAQFAAYLGRHMEAIQRTDQFEINGHQHLVSLRGFPISVISEVRYSGSPAGLLEDASIIDATGYGSLLRSGLLRLFFSTPLIPGYVSVTYTGGMAAGTGETFTENFIDAYPHIAEVADLQVIANMQRRMSPAGNMSFQGGGFQFDSQTGLLMEAKRRLDMHRVGRF